MCERIAILNHGKVAALDEKAKLLNRYPYRMLSLRFKDGEGLGRVPVATENGEITLRLHKENDKIGAIMEALHKAQVVFVDLHTKDPGLEEVFMALTGRENR